MSKIIPLAIFLCLSQTTIYSQGGEIFNKITSKEGINQSIVYKIAQDQYGNIWAGTEEGVIRFNSMESFLYNKYNGLPQNASDRITTLFIDSEDRIWIGLEKGVALYNPEKNLFEGLFSGETIKPNLVSTIIEDAQGNIWFGAFNGAWKYSPTNKEVKRFGRNLNVKALYFDDEGLLAGDQKGLFRLTSDLEDFSPVSLNGSLKTYSITSILKKDNYFLLGTAENGVIKASLDFKQITYLNLPPLAKQKYPIKDILPLDNGQICIATDGIGLIFINEQGNFMKSLSHDVNDINSISSNGVYDVMVDKENILWVATYGGGINTRNLSANYFQNITHRINDKNSIAHNFTRAVLEDKEGNIWFGTREGISIWNKKTNQWKSLSSLNKNNQTPSIIMNLKESGDFIWAATYGDGVFKINKQNFNTVQYHKNAPFDKRINVSRVYALEIDAVGNCWLGGIEDKVQVISPDKGILSYPIAQARTIINSKNGGVIIGGRNGVQHILNTDVIDYEELKTGQNGLTYTNINCLYEDNAGKLTIGTNGNGVLFYNPKNQQVHALNISNGLPSDIVQGLIYDDDQTLWISTTKGLASISFAKDTLVSIFNQADGLVSTEFNYNSFAKLSNGQVAFGGVDGVTLFTPATMVAQQFVPTVIFEDFEVLKTEDGKANSPIPSNINLAENIQLAHYENAFSIKYAGILHSTPSKVRYSWTMEGMNDNWSDAGAENQINLNNLSPGNYVFKVKAANRDGIWSTPRQLKIKIQSPWWATKTAYFIYALLAIGFLIGAFYLVTALLKKQNADEQIAFFNNITHELKTPLSILLSTLEGASKTSDGNTQSNKKIKTTVKRLNTLFEQLLNFNKVTSNRFQKREIAKIPIRDHVQQIANSFKPLLEERNISISLEDNLNQAVFYYDKEVLNKILFNLISNAVKYSKDDGAITIHLDNDRKNSLKIAVADNGIGIPKDQQKFILKRYYRGRNAINSQSTGTGLGLMIVKNLIEKDKGEISFDSIENEGTTFRIVLKNQSNAYHETAVVTPEKSAPVEKLVENPQIAEFSDAKILIVEDNDELRQIMVDKLGIYFQVFEATNGKEGLEMVGQIFPDLILTDLIMPEIDGMQMCQALQKDINTNHIPIIMMTVLNSPIQKIESVESGIAAYLEKPVDFNFLLAKITSTLTWQGKMRERYRHQTEVETAEKFRNEKDAVFINGLEKFIIKQVALENLSVHDLCRHVGMSRTALYMKLKNMVDLSPQNFIINTRLKYARKLLMETDVQVKEVAYQTGFSNPKYFSTSFKKFFGESPSAFQKSIDRK